ncbi:MAG TPA: hypothetical protein VGM06_12150 [Polyangiaceae bacterium]|jgi:hypothetical protein
MVPRTAPLTIALAAVGWAVTAPAAAAPPTTTECLMASDASLRTDAAHQLRAERTQLLVCASAACPTDIRKECIRRIEEVTLDMPTVLFEARDADGSDISAAKVTMDGEELADRLDGVPLAVDPGPHAFVFEAPNRPPVEKRLVIRVGEKGRVEAITFAGPPALPPLEAPFGLTPLPAAPRSEFDAQKAMAFVVLGIGIGGLGVGAAFGLAAMSKRDDAERACPGLCADPSGVAAWSDAKTDGNMSTVTFIAGGVLAATGIVLWATAPGSPASRAQVGVGPGRLEMRAQW